MGLPFKVRYGKIKQLYMKVPWSKLSSAPVVLTLETLILVLNSSEPNEWKVMENWKFDYKQKILEEFT